MREGVSSSLPLPLSSSLAFNGEPARDSARTETATADALRPLISSSFRSARGTDYGRAKAARLRHPCQKMFWIATGRRRSVAAANVVCIDDRPRTVGVNVYGFRFLTRGWS